MKGWENADLCSNTKAMKKPMSPPIDEPIENRDQSDGKQGTSVGQDDVNQGQVDVQSNTTLSLGYVPAYVLVNENDPDDIAKYIELVGGGVWPVHHRVTNGVKY